VFVAFSLLLVLGAALAAEHVGFSAALGTFLAGVLLAESDYRHELNIVIEPFKGLLLGLFFIAVGMSVQLPLFAEQPALILGSTLALVAVKLAVLFGVARAFRLCGQDGAVFSVMLSQVGEFAFIILTTPLLFLLVARLLIGRGYGVTLIDHDPNHIELSRRFGFRAYYGDAARRDVLESAGIEDAKLLVLAFDDPERVQETAVLVRQRFPCVRIIARARGRTEALELEELNVPFERETFRSAGKLAEIRRADLAALLKREGQADGDAGNSTRG